MGNCAGCGAPFSPPRTRWCSAKCAARYYSLKRYRRNADAGLCGYCGALRESKVYKTCPSCRRKYRRMTRRRRQITKKVK